MVRITDFSQQVGIAVPLLRHYHRRGWLLPAAVDPDTGYRQYTEAQVRDGRRLALLVRTGLDVPTASAASVADVAARADQLESIAAELRGLMTPPVVPRHRVVDLAPTQGKAIEGWSLVHGLTDVVRGLRAELPAAPGRSRRRWWSGADSPDGVLVDLHQPERFDTSLRFTLSLPGSVGRGRTVPAAVVELGPLISVDLDDVLQAHRSLTMDSLGHFQVYDARMSRLWVGVRLAGAG